MIFVWNGKDASIIKRARGLEVAHKIKDSTYASKGFIYVMEEINKDLNIETRKFWRILGVNDDELDDDMALVGSAEDGGDDLEYEAQIEKNFNLTTFDSIELSNYDHENQSITTVDKQVYSKIYPSYDLLNSKKACVLDCGNNEIYIWFGKQSKAPVRDAAKLVADQILVKRPQAEIETLKENHESVLFKEKFFNWNSECKLIFIFFSFKKIIISIIYIYLSIVDKHANRVSLEVKPQGNLELRHKSWGIYDHGSGKKSD